MAQFGYLLTIILISIPSIWWRAYVGTALWGWFIEPLIHTPSPTVWAFAGVVLFGMVFQSWTVKTSLDDQKTYGDKITHMLITALLGPFLLLCFGWLYHAFSMGHF